MHFFPYSIQLSRWWPDTIEVEEMIVKRKIAKLLLEDITLISKDGETTSDKIYLLLLKDKFYQVQRKHI